MGRQPLAAGKMGRIHSIQLEELREGSLPFDLMDDSEERRNLAGMPLEEEVTARLRRAMAQQGAPPGPAYLHARRRRVFAITR